MGNNETTLVGLSSLLAKANNIYNNFGMMGANQGMNSAYELYDALDFPTNITYEDYLFRFKRQDIANRVVKAPVDGSWKDNPKVYETDEGETDFQSAWKSLETQLNAYSVFSKFDLLGSLGRFALLFIGFDDGNGGELSIPVTTAAEVLFIQPVPENRAEVLTWVTDFMSSRYGMPETYRITVSVEGGAVSTKSIIIHWSRIIHLAEYTVDSEVYGVPYLEPIYNRLIGLDKLAGASPETYYKGARPGYAVQAADNTIITDTQLDALKEQLNDFLSKMQRWIFVEGMNITALAPQVVSPTEHVDVQLKLISAATRIPLRILTGSERGELSSTQDERAWLSYLEERRGSVCETLIIRPFIDRMIEVGVIPAPNSGEYFVEWEPMIVLSEKEQSEISLNYTRALATYTNAIGAESIVPTDVMLTWLGFSESEIDAINNIRRGEIESEPAYDSLVD